MVRHLEDVGGQVDAVPDEAALRLGPEVAGQEHAQTTDGHPDHEGQVVRLGAGDRPVGAGREDLELCLPDPQPVAGLEQGTGA